jgi:hypothetical protein
MCGKQLRLKPQRKEPQRPRKMRLTREGSSCRRLWKWIKMMTRRRRRKKMMTMVTKGTPPEPLVTPQTLEPVNL